MDKLTLPTVNQLFADAWTLTKERFWSVLILLLVQGLILVLVIAVLLAILFTTSLGALVNNQVFNSPELMTEELASSAVLGPILGIIMAVIVAVLLLAVILGPFFQAATIALVGSEKPIGVGAALRRGLKKFGAVLLVGLLTGFLMFGGILLFIIPGLVMAVLFSFAMYEVVLNNATPLQAIKTSAGMVWQHFWAVLGRFLVLIALSVVLGIIIEGWAKMDQSLAGLVNLVLNIGYSVFAMMYSVVLYRQLKATSNKVSLTLTPIAAASVLGWLVLIIILRNVF